MPFGRPWGGRAALGDGAGAIPLPSCVSDWWRTFFDLAYAHEELGAESGGGAAAIATRVEAIRTLLRLEPGMLLFDQCSGLGRMSLAFGRLGIRTIGVELNLDYVHEASRAAAAESLPCRFVAGDAGATTAPEPCHAGLNWFTSFGYHEDDERNIELLHRMWESLRPGARMVMDILSVPRLLTQFVPARVRRPKGTGLEGLVILDEPEIDWAAGMVRATWTYLWPDGRREQRSLATRMYLPHELAHLFTRAGFQVLDLLGHPDGRRFDRESPRLVVVAEKG